jgi:hypothetical protein
LTALALSEGDGVAAAEGLAPLRAARNDQMVSSYPILDCGDHVAALKANPFWIAATMSPL